jgi:hypothetical protein
VDVLTEILVIAGILVVVATSLFLLVKMFKSVGDSGSYGLLAEKMAGTFPNQLTSLSGINSFNEQMGISASVTDTYLYFSALMILALEQAGNNKDIRIPDKKMSNLSSKLSSTLIDKFLAFSRMSIKKKELLKQQAAIRKELNDAWAKGLAETSVVDFNVNAPHNAVGKAVSKALQGSFHLDFIKFCETHLSGNVILIRDILRAGQACYNLT